MQFYGARSSAAATRWRLFRCWWIAVVLEWKVISILQRRHITESFPFALNNSHTLEERVRGALHLWKSEEPLALLLRSGAAHLFYLFLIDAHFSVVVIYASTSLITSTRRPSTNSHTSSVWFANTKHHSQTNAFCFRNKYNMFYTKYKKKSFKYTKLFYKYGTLKAARGSEGICARISKAEKSRDK